LLKTSQIQSQQQKLSPQAIQAQLLLTIPTLALDQEIKKQLEDNPMLEDEKEAEQETLEKKEEEENYSFDEGYNYHEPRSHSAENSEERTEYLINKSARSRETPVEQLHKLGLEQEQIIIGEEILGNIDDDGYLRISLEEIAKDILERFGIEVQLSQIEDVLKIVQKLDPIGIASRNLQECLSIQLEDLDINDEDRVLCLRMINDYFDEFSHKHFEKLAKLLDVKMEKINELFEIIHRLNPVPGKQDTSADYIYPDFIVTKIDGKFIAELNDDSKPRVRISKKYMDMLKSPDTEGEAKEFLKTKLDSAKWFINAIQSRKDTMLKVMNAILERQKEFFETHGETLKPMFEKDIAEDISMDISTISRVVRGKYVQTDFGIFELKYFFSGAMHTESGEDVSSKMVKAKIRELIEKEDKAKPLSDDKITEIMNGAGFQMARRTVSKYRESMKIPKATLRRKILL
jgi:RNA polymerase sigma-54 factor